MQRISFKMECVIEESIIIRATYIRANNIEETLEFVKGQVLRIWNAL